MNQKLIVTVPLTVTRYNPPNENQPLPIWDIEMAGAHGYLMQESSQNKLDLFDTDFNCIARAVIEKSLLTT